MSTVDRTLVRFGPEERLSFIGVAAWTLVDLEHRYGQLDFYNSSTTSAVEISFDGVVVHATISPGQAFDAPSNREAFVYFREAAAIPVDMLQIVKRNG